MLSNKSKELEAAVDVTTVVDDDHHTANVDVTVANNDPNQSVNTSALANDISPAIAVAIALHNIPEVSLNLVYSNKTKLKYPS